MPVPVRSIRLQKRSSQSLDTLSGASGEIFFDADRGTLRLYTANQADNITLADRAWVTANTFSGNYTDLAGIPTLVYDYNELNNVPVLATVATTGNYNDLLNLPADLSSIDGIGDVDTTTDPLSTGQLLQWNGTSWVNTTIDGAQDTTYSLTIAGSAVNADLTLTPDTGLAETIEFVGGTGIDVGINLSGQVEVLNTATYAINDLTDVNISNPALNEVLAYDGAQWISSTPSTGIALTDISVGAAEAPAGDGAIAYDNTTGVFTYTPPAGGADFSTITITTEAAQGGGTLSFDGVNEFTFRPANLSNALAQLADDSSPELGGNLDLLAFQIESSSGNAVITSSTADTQINAPSGTVRLTGQTVAANALGGNINLTGDTGNLAITNTAALANIVLTSENTIDSVISSSTILSVGSAGIDVVGDVSADTFSLATPGTPVITSASTITLDAPDGTIVQNGPFRLPSLSTTQKNALSAVNGDIIYDSTISQAQVYEGSWTSISGGGGIALTDLSVGPEGTASGDGAIAYNNGTGVFTYTPPDLSSYLTSVPAQSFSSLTGKPTTLAGYGITDAFDGVFSSLTSKPTTLAGYGITDGLSASAAPLISEVSSTINGATGTVVHNTTTGGVFYHTAPATNFIANFTNVPTTNDRITTVALIIAQGVTQYMPTVVEINNATQTIEWFGGSVPGGTANGFDIVSFTLIRQSSTWTVLGASSTYG